jgi:YgiT-type zinc finger domain-containing protein
MLKIKTCPTCGSKRIRSVRRTVRRTVKGKRYIVPDLEFYECPGCGEKLYSPEAMRRIEAYSPAYAKSRRIA